MTGRRALFFDRDGVLNHPTWDEVAAAAESPLSPGDVELCDGAATAMQAAQAAGFTCVIVSNQPAAAKGQASLASVRAVHSTVLRLLWQQGACPAASYLCLHHPAGSNPRLGMACSCRKPAPGLFQKAARDHGLILEKSWLIGDTDADVGASRNAGLDGVIVVEHPLSAHRRGPTAEKSPHHALNVEQAVRQVLRLAKDSAFKRSTAQA